MKIASKKRKSALLQNLVRDKILKNFPHLKKKDVLTASTGQNGPDLMGMMPLSAFEKHRLIAMIFKVEFRL